MGVIRGRGPRRGGGFLLLWGGAGGGGAVGGGEEIKRSWGAGTLGGGAQDSTRLFTPTVRRPQMFTAFRVVGPTL